MIHTKGPWKIVQGGDEECIYIEQATYDPHGRGAVATVFTSGREPTETELADARLIAAAPDLLEALKAICCIDCVNGVLFRDSLLYDLDRDGADQSCPNCKLRYAAIAKVEGAV